MRARAAWLCAMSVCGAIVSSERRAHAAVFLTVEVEPQRAQVGEAVSVRYSVRLRDQGGVQIMPLNFGALQLLSDPAPPQVPMMWGTGLGFSMETSTEYIVRAQRPGRYVISGGRAVDPRTGRVIAQAAPATLVVGEGPSVDADAAVSTQPQAESNDVVSDPDAPPNGDMSGAYYDMVGFFRVGVDRPRVYLGEQLTYRLWAYAASPDAGCEVTEEPTFPGFWNEAAFTPTRECAQRWFSQQVNGRFMAIGLVRKYALFAAQTGRQRFGAVMGRVDVMTGGMFRQVRRAESRTPPVEVEVIEPPMEGRPEGYVPGTIGPVQLEASVDRTDCPVGETATITVRAKSVGSLSSAQLLFERNVDGARVRAAEGRTTVTPSTEGRYESVRTMELLIVAERPGTVALGEARLPYWDPSTQRYDVARVLLPTVRGTGEAIARGAQATEQPDPTRELRALSERPKLRAYAPWFSRGSRALGVAILPSVAAAIVAGASAALRYKRRVDDERASESKNDPSSLLRRAQRLLAEDEREACALASRALERAKSLAREAEVELSSEARARVREAEKVLEAVRFAGEGSAREALSRTEDAVRSVLEALR